MGNFISSELKNRLVKLGLKKQGTAGALVEGDISTTNITLINSLGKNIEIKRHEDAFDFVDPKVKEAVDNLMLDENDQPRFDSMSNFIDATMDNSRRRRENQGMSQLMGGLAQGVSEQFRSALAIVTGDASFLTKPFDDVVNCLEYATFVSVMSKIYFPDTEVRVITFSDSKKKARNMFLGVVDKTFNRHAEFIFKDNDGKVYLYITGQKIRDLDEGIQRLKNMYERNSDRNGHVPELLKKIEKERKKFKKERK